MLGRPRRATLPSRGLWRITDDRIVAIDRSYPGPTTVLVPSEDVLTLSVDLPFATRRQRIDNLPFALEDAVAEPLQSLHFALGSELSPRRHLCGIVRHDRMQRWMSLLDANDLDTCILTPDALTLPLPQTGSWAVRTDAGRALVRTDQGTGFALPARDLPTAWAAAGKPRLRPMGEPLPEAMLEGVEETAALFGSVGEPTLIIPPLDLRQGVYASARLSETSGIVKTLAAIAAVGVVAHIGILAVDVFVLDQMADRHEVEARALVQQFAPQTQPGDDLMAVVDRTLPSSVGATPVFTRLLGQTSQALSSAGFPVTFRSVAYEAGSGLSLGVVVPDEPALQASVASLNGAGLTATGAPAGADAPAASGLNASIQIARGAAR